MKVITPEDRYSRGIRDKSKTAGHFAVDNIVLRAARSVRPLRL